MPQSLAKVIVHSTFSTKGRVPILQDATLRRELYAYLATVLKNLDSPALTIGGVADHIHVLNALARTKTIAEMIEEAKTSTSKWLKTKAPSLRDFHWQNGYGIFSVSESKLPDVRRYIENQEEHHRTLTFQDEFRALCQRHGVQIDERYAWD
ncbi:MAG TPA: transposase [Pirellulales bacterium]|jgi:REP element-mobilizing transposase RayT|nr:transposase [Pirellulales bacterium]